MKYPQGRLEVGEIYELVAHSKLYPSFWVTNPQTGESRYLEIGDKFIVMSIQEGRQTCIISTWGSMWETGYTLESNQTRVQQL